MQEIIILQEKWEVTEKMAETRSAQVTASHCQAELSKL